MYARIFFLLAWVRTTQAATCDVVTVCGARPDNLTDAAPAISACVAAPNGACSPPGSTLLFPAGSAFLCGSIDLSHTINLTLSFGAGAGLYGSSNRSLYPLQPQLPPSNEPQLGAQWRALVFARNTTGLTLDGPASAVIDGCGWAWWAAFNNGSLTHQRPKLVEVVDCEFISLPPSPCER